MFRKNNISALAAMIFSIVILLFSCGINRKTEKNDMKNKQIIESERNKQASVDGITILYAEIVVHKFQNKKGEFTDISEYYLRCSVQDYFIKFCECEVSKEEILKYYNESKFINPITVEAEIRNGSWDICESIEAQSRVGEYVIIKSIIKK